MYVSHNVLFGLWRSKLVRRNVDGDLHQLGIGGIKLFVWLFFLFIIIIFVCVYLGFCCCSSGVKDVVIVQDCRRFDAVVFFNVSLFFTAMPLFEFILRLWVLIKISYLD